ncbi:MAG TPA: DNA mismatch repair endonuclease MutL [Alphaproteobacteria bacterium]|nr:DNA mismatch repair endonuclease MutL [Alphaproteobacteria bacterium]
MPIRRLPEGLANRIAAGEVIERPAACVKELVENALDAGARRVDVAIRDGGLAEIVAADDGVGMGASDLALAIERHATSKLDGDDLVDIRYLGFRGEALPSIGAVSRLTIESRVRGAADAFAIEVEGGRVAPVRPAALAAGTRVAVRDLFYATPARLKFMKSTRTESDQVSDVIQRLAMAHPDVAFTLTVDGASKLRFDAEGAGLFPARLARLSRVMGREFADNALAIDAEREGIRLAGFAGSPTLSRATAQAQYLFVNGRPVRDRLLVGALRGAYQDVLARDRHPMVALFLDLPPAAVDVNVHPAKAEVRFRDSGLVRGLIVGALRHALAAAGHRPDPSMSSAALGAFRPEGLPPRPTPSVYGGRGDLTGAVAEAFAPSGISAPGFGEGAQATLGDIAPSARVEPPAEDEETADYPLGVARAQLHDTYIVAQTADGLVIVDQHAAHERLVFERIRAALAGQGVARQILLIPEVVEMDPAAAQRLLDRLDELAKLGLLIEPFGNGAVVVRETPALLGVADVRGLMIDLADEIAEYGAGMALADRLERVCATMACHGSVRAGRRLTVAEMNALLREMESVQLGGHDIHHRPTFVELKKADIEKLFGRR